MDSVVRSSKWERKMSRISNISVTCDQYINSGRPTISFDLQLTSRSSYRCAVDSYVFYDMEFIDECGGLTATSSGGLVPHEITLAEVPQLVAALNAFYKSQEVPKTEPAKVAPDESEFVRIGSTYECGPYGKGGVYVADISSPSELREDFGILAFIEDGEYFNRMDVALAKTMRVLVDSRTLNEADASTPAEYRKWEIVFRRSEYKTAVKTAKKWIDDQARLHHA